MKIKTKEEADVNITSLIDCLMQCIIFFMVIMSANSVFGVAIKFSQAGGKAEKADKGAQEKSIAVYVQADILEENHYIIKEGVLKLNGEEIPLATSADRSKWPEEQKRGYDLLEKKIGDLISQGYKKDAIMVQGDLTAYHGKIMAVIDRGKAKGIESFSLVIAYD